MTTELSATSRRRTKGQQKNLQQTDNYRSESPFPNALKAPLKNGNILRTRSLDDHQHHHEQQKQRMSQDIEMLENSNSMSSSPSCGGDNDEGTTVATALHSSFDASLLRGTASYSSGDITLFENGIEDDEGDCGVIKDERNRPSFDSLESPGMTFPNQNEYHLRQSCRKGHLSYLELKPPATVRKSKLSASRKARRRSSDSATTATTAATHLSHASLSYSLSKTPARTPGRPLRHGNTINNNERTPGKTPGKSHKSPIPTPTTAKRRRAPFAHPARLSPMRRVVASSSSTTPTPFVVAPPFGVPSQFISLAENASDTKSFSTTQTPTHQNLSMNGDPHGSFLKKLPYHTGTTAGTTPLETTFEADGDSVDTNSPARFRFTSFPASLPRVHHTGYYHPRSTPPVCPGSVRKRMSFDTEDDTLVAEHKKSGNNDSDHDDDDPVGLNYSIHQQDAVNHSRDDDTGTHNTSLSSLSVDGGHHQHLPHLPHQHPAHFASAPTKNLLLFPGEQDDDNGLSYEHNNNNLFGYSDDDEDDVCAGERFATVPSPDQDGTVTRTRLDFNVFLSPDHKNTITESNNNTNLKENEDIGRQIDLLPNSVDLSRPYDAQNRINSFPSSLSSHTQVNASTHTQEENIMGSTSSMSPPRTRLAKNTSNGGNPPKTPREVHLHFPLESECSPILGACTSAAMLDCQQQIENHPSVQTRISSSTTKLVSHPKEEGTVASILSHSSSDSTTTTQRRRLRPMPDMSAFENVKSSSMRQPGRSTDDNNAAGRDTRGIVPLSRRGERVCPPTPQRTPAWANEAGGHAFFPVRKQNSLIATKVLLSCPSQVLQGRSSLETSVLEDDNNNSNSRRNSLSNSCDSIASNSNADRNKTHVDEMDIDVPGGFSVSNADVERKDQIEAPPKLMRRLPSNPDMNEVISFSDDFEILGSLGSGAFADVYKVRLKSDNNLYAVKRNRRQFRGKRDRDVALAEVQSMQRLQSVFATQKGKENSESSSDHHKTCYSLYLLFFYRAWQEEGYFYSQTELCCRDTCHELLESLRFKWNSAKTKYPSLVKKLPPPTGVEAGSTLDSFGRLVPNMTVWKICHDVSAGLSHIHSHGIVHQDIKPSNLFLVTNARFGAMVKIGDFGLAGSIGSSGDGQEGDTRYMPSELLASGTRHASGDIFSLGLTLYEIATDEHIEMPSEGQRWHQLRSNEEPTLPACRGDKLQRLLRSMTDPDERRRPTADAILENENVMIAGHEVESFLQEYINDVEEYDRREEELLAMDRAEDQTPRNSHRAAAVMSPSLSMLLPGAPSLFSPSAKTIHS